MSQNLPETIPELVSWANTRGPIWVSKAATIGLTPAQAESFSELATVMSDTVTAATMARASSKAATLTQTDSIAAFRIIANAYISLIKGFAASTNNPEVYAVALVNPDSPKSTLPPPVPPTAFTASVNTGGSITIKWKVTQPAGVSNVSYLVSRRINAGNPAVPFTFVGTVSNKKSYTDMTLPTGVDKVEYVITPKRGTVTGAQSPVFLLQFGSVVPPGEMSLASQTSVPHAAPVKIAA